MNRYVSRSIIAALGLVCSVLYCVSPAAAQGVVSLTVVKSVNGTFPANTVFTVSVICDPDDPANDVSTTLSFASNGSPLGSNTISLNENDGGCLIRETGTGGAASVTYACTDNTNSVDPQNPNGSICAGLNGAGEFFVDYDVIVVDGLAATVTITNTPAVQQPQQPAASVPALGDAALVGTVLALGILSWFALRRR